MARKGDCGKPSVKEQFWRDMLLRWQRSEQTIRHFCSEHGLGEQSFYTWRRTIAQRDQQNAAVQHDRPTVCQAATADDGPTDLPAFVPLRVTPAALSGQLELVTGPGRVIRIPPDFDAATLRKLLAILEEGPSC
jgi:hypothetical protein